MRELELRDQIQALENQIEPLRQELQKIYSDKSKEVKERIKLAEKMEGKFNADELIFSAYSRCSCGAGIAYPKNIGPHGSWCCSSILLGTAERGSSHDESLPFAFYEVKSENQPSANGATTRPIP